MLYVPSRASGILKESSALFFLSLTHAIVTRYVVFFLPSNSVTPAGCPMVDLSSDPVYPEIPSIRLCRLRTESHITAPSLQRPVASLGWKLCFWLMDSKSNIPSASFLSLMNLLEWFPRLRKSLLTIHQFIMKGYDKWYRWTSRGKRWAGQSMWEGAWSFCASLGMPLSLHFHVCVNPEALWSLFFGEFHGSLMT